MPICARWSMKGGKGGLEEGASELAVCAWMAAIPAQSGCYMRVLPSVGTVQQNLR